MANITLSNCPNFNGGAHDNSDLSFVPWQLHGAHLFGLNSLGSTRIDERSGKAKSAEKNPCTWERNPKWVKLTPEEKAAKRKRGEKIETYYIGWGEWEGGVKKQAKGRYGVCLTRSGFFVLDIDTHHGVDGNETFANWLSELGIPNDFQTFTVATGTGGFHYYFQLPRIFQETEIRKATDLLPGIDVFPSGQFVVGPGTTRTMPDGSIARYEVSRDLPIAEMPQPLVDALVDKLRAANKIVDPEEKARQEEQRREAEARRKHRREHPEEYPDTTLSDGQRRMVDQLLSEMSSLPDGQRHAGIFSLAHSIGKITGWDQEDYVLPQVLEAAWLSGHEADCAEKDARNGYNAGAALFVDYREQNRIQRELERKPNRQREDDPTVPQNEKQELPPLTGEFFNDGGVASAYQDARKGELVSVNEWNSWARFSPQHGVWKKTNSSEIVSDLLDWYRAEVYPALKEQLRAEAEAVKDDPTEKEEQEKRAKKLLAKAGGYLNLTPCRNATGVAFGRLMRSADLFDADKDVLHINGTAIDLRTTAIRPATPEDYFTASGSRLVDEVDPSFKSELFELILGAFLPETREYMQVLIGSALTGHQPNPAGLFFLQADGDNGKSTFADVFKALLGGYSEQIDSDILLNSQNSKTFANIRVKGKRFIPIEELPKNGQLDSKASKGLAGTKSLTGAHKGVDEETFDVQATFLINTNYKLKVSETDRGTRKRLKLIPMPYTFLPQDEYDEQVARWHREGRREELTIKPQDPRLDGAEDNPEILKAALAWALEGARKFYANGKRILPETPAMKAAKREWLSSQDRISLWWDEFIIEDEDSFCLVLDLHESYERSVLAGGSNQRPEAQRQFMEMLKSHDNFKAAGAEHFQNKRVPKALSGKQSLWTPEKQDHWDEPEKRIRRAKAVASFVKGIRFKTDEDFDKEAAAQEAEEKAQALSQLPGIITIPDEEAVDDLTPADA
ncbi:bifunctional DNA primase/polymerase [Microbacterium barkeri]|uniref:bifunctional DNA primase/polymerase n=1 Tax=Microbacterium barkeri TaxID=33917 RepID=UPI0022F2A144|nr:bifunctional DNA primase/polymerase [Microbacterium barkeri]MDI6944209.1 bifunctional DNA primase/polymerase [Microbacterium barkeri]MDR6876781.1 phage/plasmid-associated DNA primase [Microbacterium barkeri]